MSIPSKHHYIPQFFIRGFAGADKWYHCYDKQTARINPISSSKGMFYEKDRYTITAGTVTDNSIEKVVYKHYDDNLHPTHIKELQSKPVTPDLLTKEYVRTLIDFALVLYWRIPESDKLYEKVFNEGGFRLVKSEQDEVGTEFFEYYRKSEFMKKGHKAFMNADTVAQYEVMGLKTEINYGINELTGTNDYFVLGDYPLIYPSEPVKITDLLTQPHYMPISSKRIYRTTPENILNYDTTDVLTINAVTIHQSTRYSCCANKAALEESIKLYKSLILSNRIESARRHLFEG